MYLVRYAYFITFTLMNSSNKQPNLYVSITYFSIDLRKTFLNNVFAVNHIAQAV